MDTARRSPLAQAFRRPGPLVTGAVRFAPQRRASATSYEPRVSADGHTVPGGNPAQHAAQQPAAAAVASAQSSVPLAVQSPPTYRDIVLHNALPERQKTAVRTVTAAGTPSKEPGSDGTTADEKPPINSWVLFVQERYAAEMHRLPAGQHDRKSVMRHLSRMWHRSSELQAKYSARHRELQRAFMQRHQAAEPELAPNKRKQRRAVVPSVVAEERLAEVQAQLREVQAGYRRLGDDVAFQQEQLWNQAGVLRAAVNEDVTCRLQQVTAENGRLWLLAITQHQNAVASAQAMQVAQLQLEVRSLRALVAAADEAQRPRGGPRMVLASVIIAAGALLTTMGVMAVWTGASSALQAGVSASSQLQQPYVAPAVLIIGALLTAAAVAQGCVAAFAALRNDD